MMENIWRNLAALFGMGEPRSMTHSDFLQFNAYLFVMQVDQHAMYKRTHTPYTMFIRAWSLRTHILIAIFCLAICLTLVTDFLGIAVN